MNDYYRILRLRSGDSIMIDKECLSIDLDRVDLSEMVTDDQMFDNSISDTDYFWVSGGGTYFVNKRYIFLIKRGSDVRVNPDKYSLFTGRANSLDEIFNPEMTIRELFEELVLFSDKIVYYPRNSRYQDIIDQVYQDLGAQLGLDLEHVKYLELDDLTNFNRNISIRRSGNRLMQKLNYHINTFNDINIIFLLSTEIDISDLSATDGEYHTEGQEVIRQRRKIYLYDILSSEAREISAGMSKGLISIKREEMTEHLDYVVRLLENTLE